MDNAVKVELVAPELWRLEGAVDADAVEARLAQALRVLGRDVDLPGFRKGKAPLAVLRRLYGKDVLEQLGSSWALEALWTAILARGLYPATPPMPEAAAGAQGGLDWSAEVRVFTPLGPIAPEALEVELPAVEITDEDVRREIDTLRDEGEQTTDEELAREHGCETAAELYEVRREWMQEDAAQEIAELAELLVGEALVRAYPEPAPAVDLLEMEWQRYRDAPPGPVPRPRREEIRAVVEVHHRMSELARQQGLAPSWERIAERVALGVEAEEGDREMLEESLADPSLLFDTYRDLIREDTTEWVLAHGRTTARLVPFDELFGPFDPDEEP